MTQDALANQLGTIADAVVADSRWQQDDLSVAILGMLLYGFAVMTGRTVMYLDIEDIDAAVIRSLTEHVGVAANWSGGLVADANASAFNKDHHPGNFELIGIGHSYFGVKDQKAVIDNIFGNIASYRRAADAGG